MTVGSQKYCTGHTAVGRASRKSQRPNPTKIRRGSVPATRDLRCSFRIGEGPTLPTLSGGFLSLPLRSASSLADGGGGDHGGGDGGGGAGGLEFPAERPLADRRCRFAMAPGAESFGSASASVPLRSASAPLFQDSRSPNLKPVPQTLSQKNHRLRRSEHGLWPRPPPSG
jgi:hypothetical protein